MDRAVALATTAAHTSHLLAWLLVDDVEGEVDAHALEVALGVEVVALHPRREVGSPVQVDVEY